MIPMRGVGSPDDKLRQLTDEELAHRQGKWLKVFTHKFQMATEMRIIAFSRNLCYIVLSELKYFIQECFNGL